MIAATAVDTIDTTDYQQAFSKLWTRGILWGCENPTLFWFVEEVSRSAFRNRDKAAIRWLDFELVREFIETGIRRGIIIDVPVNLIHTIVMSTISGIVAEILTNSADRETIIASSRDIVWRALHAEE
jgi:hypothetical protein